MHKYGVRSAGVTQLMKEGKAVKHATTVCVFPPLCVCIDSVAQTHAVMHNKPLVLFDLKAGEEKKRRVCAAAAHYSSSWAGGEEGVCVRDQTPRFCLKVSRTAVKCSKQTPKSDVEHRFCVERSHSDARWAGRLVIRTDFLNSRATSGPLKPF